MSFLSPIIARPYRTKLADYVADRERGARRPDNRMTRILDQSYCLRDGRELIEFGASENITASFALLPYFMKRRNAQAECHPNLIRFNPLSNDGDLITSGPHELRHARQEKNLKKKHGEVWDRRATTVTTNHLYADVIREGDSHTHDTINRYELHLNGNSRPWTAKLNYPPLAPLATALIEQVELGNDLHSDETKRAIFHAWMTKASLRVWYDARAFTEFARISSRMTRLLSSAYPLTCTSDDLYCIANDNQGHSYLAGMDLMRDDYVVRWKSLTSAADVRVAADDTELLNSALFMDQDMLKKIAVIEGELAQEKQMAPRSISYQQALANIGVALERKNGMLAKVDDIPDAKIVVIEMFRKADGLLARHPDLINEIKAAASRENAAAIQISQGRMSEASGQKTLALM